MNQAFPLDVATIAGGCCWCVEAVYREIDGVEYVVSGYTGGTAANPNYEQVAPVKLDMLKRFRRVLTLPVYLIGKYWRFSSLSMI